MNLFNKDVLKRLVEREPGPSVSIFMPVARAVPEARQNPIRLRNLLREVEAKLEQFGLTAPEIKLFMQPAYDLNNDEFWQHRRDGMALFVDAEGSQHYHLPYPMEAAALVGQHWHLKPLLPVLMAARTFYILAISRNLVRFWQATPFGFLEIELTGVPASMKDSLESDHFERELQFHSAGPTRAGGRDVHFYGTGSTSLDEKGLLRQYLLGVDRAVLAKLKDERVPLVVAAVDYEASMFRELSQYPNVVPTAISGNPDLETPESLHRKAVDIVTPIFETEMKSSVESLKQSIGKKNQKASIDLRDIVPASRDGRVWILFVSLGRKVWGKSKGQGIEISTSEADQTTDDLLDLASLHTLANGGTVYALPAERMPGRVDLAAIMRY